MAFELKYSVCFLLILLLHLPLFTTSQPYHNISLGSSLVAQDDDSAWLSPSEEFAFGFQRIGNDGGFLLAIWFNKIPEKTIAWSAINGSLFQEGSKVEFTVDGIFIKDFETGNQHFISDQTAATGVAYAAMLDTGNFVLANQNSNNLWETFHYPTNTILPTQTLSRSTVLFARYTETNYSKGRFQLNLQSDGNLVLYTTNFPLDTPNFPYWSTHTRGSGFQVIFNTSGYIFVTDIKGSVVSTVSGSDKMASVKDYYQRATLDSDGVFRHYVYHKSNGSVVETGTRAWSTLSFQPPNICTAIKDRGGGPCGFNSICKHDDQGPTFCQCPQGYTFIDENRERKGCKQNFNPQSCDESSPESHLFGFSEMLYTDWPSGDYEHFHPVEEDWCKQSCLGDCFCAIAIYNKDSHHCYKKGIPLSNGRNGNSTRWKSLIKLRKDNSTLKPEVQYTKKEISALVHVGSVLMLIISCLIISIITYLFFSRLYSKQAKMSDLYPLVQGINLKRYTYMELNEATEGFKEELGRGAFATVYKGVLASDNGKGVAVKRLDSVVRENDFEFKAEVSTIGGTNHKNLVKLLGFCNEGQHRILVYEFMTNGSLSSYLFGNSRPSWYQRREIAAGTARGLRYLHEECSSQIIHCDIKPQNILLDDSFTARIADFGVAKLLKMDQTRTTTRFRGTKGYVAPEWFKSLPVTVKADVYSFGILLLEIICCRKHYEENMQDEEQMILVDWAYDCYEQKKLHLLIKNDDDEAKENIKNMELFFDDRILVHSGGTITKTDHEECDTDA